MDHIIEVFILALSVSLDAFILGISYGIRGTAVPWGSRLIIGGMSGLVMGLGIFAGRQMSRILSSGQMRWAGALLLMGMGIWYMASSLLKKGEELDLDGSRHLDRKEALLLGLVLSVDGSAVGIGSAMLNMNGLLLILLVCVCQIGLLQAGLAAGRKRQCTGLKMGTVSGLLFILIGLWRLAF